MKINECAQSTLISADRLKERKRKQWDKKNHFFKFDSLMEKRKRKNNSFFIKSSLFTVEGHLVGLVVVISSEGIFVGGEVGSVWIKYHKTTFKFWHKENTLPTFL